MIEYRVAELEEVLDQMKDMFFSHAAETELYQDKIKLNPNYNTYLALSDANSFYFVIAEEDGEIVGYMSLMVHEHPHHKDILTCMNNLLFVKEEYRGKSVAANMFQVAEDFLKDSGVSLFIFAAKAKKPLKSLADSMGFDECEVMYSKYIGGDKE